VRAPFLVSALLTALSAPPAAAQLTPQERQRLAAHLEMTAGWLADELSGLSQAQLEFHRAPGTWSILEVLDHLVVVGDIYWNDLQQGAKTPLNGRVLNSRDADILWYGIDRTNRETAIPPENPRGRVRDAASGLELYRKQHARLLQYVKTTRDDLRDRYVQRQACDGYQWALLISTHVQRHVLQIREIKSDPKFPKR
jgi:hypothetical protein